MDPIGGASAIISFLQLAAAVASWVDSAIKAPEERALLRSEVQGLKLSIDQWSKRIEEARKHPDNEWYKSISGLMTDEELAAVKSGSIEDFYHEQHKAKSKKKPFLERHKIFRFKSSDSDTTLVETSTPDPQKPSEVFEQFVVLRRQLEASLTEHHGFRGALDRATWSTKKTSAADLQKNIRSFREQLNEMLAQGHFDLLLQVREDVQTGLEQINKGIKGITGGINKNQIGIESVAAEVNKIKLSMNTNTERKTRKDQNAELQRLKKWVSPLDFRAQESELLRDAFPGGRWLIEHPIFKGWLKGGPKEMRCYGAPGSGKTLLSCLVLDHLRNTFNDFYVHPDSKERTAVLSLLIKYGSPNQDGSKLYASLLKQMMDCLGDLTPIQELNRANRRLGDGAMPSEAVLEPILLSTISLVKTVYIVIDALDECLTDQIRASLVDRIQTLRKQTANVRVMFTSRPEEHHYLANCDVCGKEDIKIPWRYWLDSGAEYFVCQQCEVEGKGLANLEPSEEAEIQVETPPNEIQDFVKWALEKQLGFTLLRPGERSVAQTGPRSTTLGRILQRSSDLQQEIPRKITQMAGHRFLLAKLYIDKMLLQTNEEEVRDTLSNLPEELDDIYYDVFNTRVENNDSRRQRELGLKVLMWTAYARKDKLTLSQLQHAIEIRPDDTRLRPGIGRDVQTIYEATAGLVMIDFDGIVDFHHLTAREYFERNCKQLFPEGQAQITDAILTYIKYNEFSIPCESNEAVDQRLTEYPFLIYAARNWGFHLRNLDINDSRNAKIRDKALTILMDKRRTSSLRQADPLSWDILNPVGMQVCGRFGLAQLIPLLEQRGSSVDDADHEYRQTGLMYASRLDQEDTVSEFVRAGAEVNHISVRGTTALHEAVNSDSDSRTIGLLLEAGADVNARISCECDRSALIVAAAKNNMLAVSLLTKQLNLDVNLRDAHGMTALMAATQYASISVIQNLLDHSAIEVNLATPSGRTALSFAAESRNEDIVTTLLSKGADPNIKRKVGDRDSATVAAAYGNLDALTVFLDSYPDLIGSSDDRGRGLLHYVCSEINYSEDDERTRRALVDLLLSKGLDVNVLCKNRRATPLHEACRVGNLVVAQYLLSRNANPSIEDIDGRTPFLVAWLHGKDDLTALFTARTPFLPTPPLSSLPPWSLVQKHQDAFLLAQLAAGTLNPSSLCAPDPDTGCTALHYAVTTSNIPLLSALLSHSSPSSPIINSQDFFARTPLFLAAYFDKADPLRVLLAHGANWRITNAFGDTPLDAALGRQDWEVALALVEAGAMVSKRKGGMPALLAAAVREGRPKAVRELMKQGADPMMMSGTGVMAEGLVRKGRYGEEVRKSLREALRGLG